MSFKTIGTLVIMTDILKGKFVKILTFKELSFLSLIFDKNEVLCKASWDFVKGSSMIFRYYCHSHLRDQELLGSKHVHQLI